MDVIIWTGAVVIGGWILLRVVSFFIFRLIVGYCSADYAITYSGIGLLSSFVSLHQLQVRCKNANKSENFLFHDAKMELSLVRVSWHDIISYLAYRKALKIEISRISVKTRAYPSESHFEKANSHSPSERRGSGAPSNNGRKLVSLLRKHLSQLIIGQIHVQVQLYNSEFDQSETVWELTTDNMNLVMDETSSESLNEQACVSLRVDSIRPAISLPKTQLFKLDFPLIVSYQYSLQPTAVFDASRTLDITVPKLRMEAEVKVAGIIAKVLQKDNAFRNSDSSYSSKAKLIYSNLLGKIYN